MNKFSKFYVHGKIKYINFSIRNNVNIYFNGK